ncbi:hypothetical protein NX773_23145 [Massilia solisilvae]|uniref:Lipoprotein n=1 Tax=Massilia solisilvae TaxID=1811225 RepID=A0ABT2BRC1_9BURK|nr:hypothetical protein [Massilia solisilvae]MCS0611061.1 hypothetical protein [Massilia solisilvae]
MFRKLGMAAGCAVFCAGCSTALPAFDHGPVQMDGVRVNADLVDLTQLKVYVNGEKVIDDGLSLPRGEGSFRGNYAGKPVLASCSTRHLMASGATSCVITVGSTSRSMLF